MNYSINELRHDVLNIHRVTTKSPLYQLIFDVTTNVYRKLAERLSHDISDFDDAHQRAMIRLTSPMSTKAPISPLEYYLIEEFDRRSKVGEKLEVAEFRSILYAIIRNELLAIHKASYVENNVEGCVEILRADPSISRTPDGRYYTVGSDPTQVPTHLDIQRVANICSQIPKLPQVSEKRNSPVYSPENRALIAKILISEANGIAKVQIYEIFSLLLTSWQSSTLSTSDEATNQESERAGSSAPADAEVGNAEFALQAATRIWRDLSENQRRYMHAHTWNVTQAEIASRVEFVDQRDESRVRKYSRPWIVELESNVLARLAMELEPYDRDEQLDIVHLLTNVATNYKF